MFDENEGYNFMQCELARHGMDGIGTVVECMMRILEGAKRASPTASQKGEEPIWENSSRQLFRYTIPPLYAATGTLDISDIIRMVCSAPTSYEEVTDKNWQGRSFMYEIMNKTANDPVVPMSPEALKSNIAFWAEEWPRVPEKTRGSIIINISSVLDRFRHGRLKRAFCEKTTLVPELSFHGAVIVLAMPTLTWNEDGVIAQHLFKYLWQRSVLTRNSLAKEHRERPLFLYSDEAQETASSYDGEFLGLCRGSKCCVMYMSQSLPTYIAKMGGDNPRDAAHGLLGKFTTHVFNSNACAETNEFASRTIGKVVKRRANYSAGESRNVNYGMNVGSGTNEGTSSNSGRSSSYSNSGSNSGHNSGSGSSSGKSNNWGSNRGRGYGDSVNHGYTEVLEPAIEPGEFARTLRTGGKQNGYEVTGVWFQGGRMFQSTGLNMLLATFRQ